MTRGSSFELYRGDGAGGFQAAVSFTTVSQGMGSEPIPLIVADCNGDGKPDIVIANSGSFTISIAFYAAAGSGGAGRGLSFFPMPPFAVVTTPFGTGADRLVKGTVARDFNGDGIPDVLMLSYSGGLTGFSLALGNGDGTFQPFTAFGPTNLVDPFKVADLNGDGKPDIAVLSFAGLIVFVSNGDGTFAQGATYNVDDVSATGSPTAILTADINKDGNIDLLIPHPGSKQIVVLYGNGDGTFHPGTISLPTKVVTFAVADFNGDGIPDVTFASYSTDPSMPQKATIFSALGQGDGTFQPPAPLAQIDYARGLRAVDLRGDGKADIVFDDNNQQVAVLLGNGDGTFLPSLQLAGAQSIQGAAIADLDGDGIPDVAIADVAGTVRIFLGNGDGTFQAPVSFGASGGFIDTADFNRDGRQDLLIAGQGFQVLLGRSPGAASFTIGSYPARLQLIADGVTYTAPATFSWVPGSSHTVTWTTPQAGTAGVRYSFAQWADGFGSASRTFTAPSDSAHASAFFTTQYLLTKAILSGQPGTAGAISATPDSPSGYYAPNTTVTVLASPAPGFVFDGLYIDGRVASNPATIKMSAPRTAQAYFYCPSGVTPANTVMPSGSGAGSLLFTTGCPQPYTISSVSPWITLTSPASGAGNSTITFTVQTNPSPSNRVGYINYNGQINFAVTQLGTTGILLNPTSSYGTSGDTWATVTVYANPGFMWTAVSSAAWVQITAGATGTGNGSFTYHALDPVGTSNAIITIAGEQFYVTPGYSASSADSVTPNAGTGRSGNFTFRYSNPSGYAVLRTVKALFSRTFSEANACSVYYSVASNALYLWDDAHSATIGPLTPGASDTLQNSQCVISGIGSSATGLGNTLPMTVAVTFKAGFDGNLTAFAEAIALGSDDSRWHSLGTWNSTVAIATPPTADSVNPSSGVGISGNFTLRYSSVNGNGVLSAVHALFNGTLNGIGACWVSYVPAVNGLFLMNDTQSAWLGPMIPGSVGTLQNSQCTLDAAASTVTGAANTLTAILALRFKPSFNGTETVYGTAFDSGNLTSGWQALGTWKSSPAPGTPPTPNSVTPNSGNGNSGTFTFQYSSIHGYGYMTSVHALFNGSPIGANGCWVYYLAATNGLYLYNDTATATSGPVTPGGPGALQNSQCRVNVYGSPVTVSGNTLTMTLAIAFTATFSGTQNIYGAAEDNGGLTSGWQTLGAWNSALVPDPTPPVVSGITPINGSGSSQVFTAGYYSPGGGTNIGYVTLLFNSSLSGAGGCWMQYQRATNSLYLVNDPGTGVVAGAINPGTPGTLSNSQCTIGNAGAATLTASTLTLPVTVTFIAGFTGPKVVYAAASTNAHVDGAWQTVGTWNAGGAPPSVVSVSPINSGGSPQLFTATYSDTAGGRMWVI